MSLSQSTRILNTLRQPSEQPRTFYSIYQSGNAIEIRSGCNDYQELRLISSCFSYEQACEIAQNLANVKQMPVQDWVQ
ncbi:MULTISPECIES: hypothetical protein [Desertifilum]|uniref:hypothetical protein n=1 Tax=unclassified Desertifilum TaxID=2621682 RepID=UPI00114CBABF|nr:MULTISPECIES: hypothetical protein [Desertifilum]MBD2324742.1 hypothetical protein [Desertifilum sp. FACHB-866]MBD2334864.1 hypothetical protein [Desertifilum sp. FACHB-868]